MKKMAVVVCGAEHDIARVIEELKKMFNAQIGEPEDLGVCGVQSQSLLIRLFSGDDENAIGQFIERTYGTRISVGYCECP